MTHLLGALALIAAAVAIAAYAGRNRPAVRPHVTDDRLAHIDWHATPART